MQTTKWSTRSMRTRLAAPALLLGIVLAGTLGCNNAQQAASSPAQTAQPSNESFTDFGNYEVHYNALRTDALTPEIARSYGIQRSSNRVMLNVTALRKQADHAPRQPVDAAVQVDAYNLNGQLKNIEMRRVSEGDAIYYIGEVSISGAEILVFDISVTPGGEANALKVKFKREFFAN
ncbi:MAG: DUF4426 domain-containing protein [Steroidobacteraceae bacterium]